MSFAHFLLYFCLQLTFQNKAKTEKADERFKSVQDMVVTTKSVPGKKGTEKVFIFGVCIVRFMRGSRKFCQRVPTLISFLGERGSKNHQKLGNYEPAIETLAGR